MLKSLSLTLVALSSYVLSLPVVCNTLMANEIRVAQAVEGEANVLDELLEVPEFRETYLNGDYDADPGVDDFDVLYAVENGYDGTSPYSLYLYVWNKSGNGNDVYNFNDNYNSISIYDVSSGSNNNYNIEFINKSYNDLFIKYRIPILDSQQFVSETGSREYGITGIQIGHYENNLVKYIDYSIAKKWNFEDDDLGCIISYNSKFDVMDDIHLGGGAFPFGSYDNFNYFSWTQLTINRTQQNLYYVYFDVPKTYALSETLYSIHADYYDFDFSNKLAFLIDDNNQQFYIDNYDYFISQFEQGANLQSYGFSQYSGDFIFHAYFDELYPELVASHDESSISKHKLFHTDPYTQTIQYGTTRYWRNSFTPSEFLSQYPLLIPINVLTDDISGHLVSSYFDRHLAEVISGQNSEDVYHNIHYRNPGIDGFESDAIEVDWDLVSEVYNHWAIWEWFHDVKDSVNVQNLKCIERVYPEDVNLSNDGFVSRYYVNPKDVSDIKSRIDDNSITYIFRFKLAPSSSTEIDYHEGTNDYYSTTNPYTFEQVGFASTEYHGVVDFDVLDLTFVNPEKEILETVPVVSSPVNVFPDVPSPIRKPSGCGGFWKTLVMILTILALVLLIFLFLKWFIPWKRNRQVVNAIKSSGKSSSKSNTVNHYTYNIKKTYIGKSSHKKRKKRRK